MKRKIQVVVTGVIGAAILFYLFRDLDWKAAFESIGNVRKVWLLVTLGFVVGSFFARVQRWSYIVRVAKPVSFRHMFSATQIGFLVNFTVPGRIGEIVRALVLTRLAKLPFPKSVAMAAVDRITDMFGLIVVMAISVLGFRIKQEVTIPPGTLNNTEPIVFSHTLVEKGEILTGVMLLVLVIGLIVVYLNQAIVIRWTGGIIGVFSKKLAEKAKGMIQHFAEGLHIFRNAKDMTKSLFWSLVTWGCFVGSITAMMQAFNMPWPWYTPFVVQTLLAICMAVPVLPGVVGQFHLPIVVGIVATIPQVAPPEAMGLAIVTHLINIIPIALTGVYCLYIENVGILELSREAQKASEESPSPT